MNKEGAKSLQQPREKPSQNNFKACKCLKPHNKILNNKYQPPKKKFIKKIVNRKNQYKTQVGKAHHIEKNPHHKAETKLHTKKNGHTCKTSPIPKNTAFAKSPLRTKGLL